MRASPPYLKTKSGKKLAREEETIYRLSRSEEAANGQLRLPIKLQNKSQLPERGADLARLREVVARLRGGETRDNQQETTEASTGGGRVGGR